MKTEKTERTFKDLLRDFEKQAINADDEKAYTETMYKLATAVAYSVLKKCIDPQRKSATEKASDSGCNPTLIALRRSIAKDLHDIGRLKYSTEHAYETKYDSNGDTYTEITDKDMYEAVKTLTKQTYGDGLDLVHDAIIVLLTETEKAKSNGCLSVGFLEKPYTVRTLNRKVYIKDADTVNGWKDETTTPIQQAYKAVRRSIENCRPLHIDVRNQYIYFDDIATDTESNTTDRIYRRLPKCYGVGDTVTDFNGKPVSYIANETVIHDTDEIIASMNLTARQAKILELRISGHGQKAIATYLGVSKQAVQKVLKQIQVKAVSVGLSPKE